MTESECSLLRSLISNAGTIVLCCHQNPDGDALGSCLGWSEYLQTLGKDAVIIVPDQFPDYLRWLPNTEKIIRYDKHQERADLLLKTADVIFCLDFNTAARTDKMADTLLATQAKRALMDHHLGPDMPTVLTVSHPEASSTSELVFRIVWQLEAFEQQTKKFAVPVYCGMMTDTGGFTYNSSDPDIFFIISQLLTKGINKDKSKIGRASCRERV